MEYRTILIMEIEEMNRQLMQHMLFAHDKSQHLFFFDPTNERLPDNIGEKLNWPRFTSVAFALAVKAIQEVPKTGRTGMPFWWRRGSAWRICWILWSIVRPTDEIQIICGQKQEGS